MKQKRAGDAKLARASIIKARELTASGQFMEVLSLIATLPESVQQNGRLQFLRARALMNTGDTEQARLALEAAALAGVPEKAVLDLRITIQKLMNDGDGLLLTFARLVELDPTNPILQSRRARDMMALGRVEEATNAAWIARDLAPDDPETHGLVCIVAAHFRDVKGYLDALEYTLAHLPGPQPPNDRVIRHLQMLLVGDVGDLSARIEARWPGTLQKKHSSYQVPAPRETWQRPLVQSKNEHELVCSPPGDRGITIVMFSGLGRNLSKVLAFDSHAAAAGCNVIYVNSHIHDLYLPVDRSKDPLTELLRTAIANYNTQKLIVCGHSIGAVPALFYGLALEADRLISLSGPTGVDMRDRRAPMLVASLMNKFSLEQLDTRNVTLAASTAKTAKPLRYDFYYGDKMMSDRRHAERMAGIQGVRLFPLEGFGGHDSFAALTACGRAKEIFTV